MISTRTDGSIRHEPTRLHEPARQSALWRGGPLVALLGGLLASPACGERGPAQAPTSPAAAPTAASEPADPEALLDRVEAALVGARTLTIEASITSEGAFPARLDGRVTLTAPNRVELAFDGTFGDRAVAVRFASDGATMTGDVPAPPHLAEAIVIGMARMGLLHNLAVLIAGGAPDHGAGGVREWVVARRVRFAPPRVGPAANEAVVMFDIEVAGQQSGEASLWIDTSRDLPTGRVQTVHFEGGDMTVRESYRIHLGQPTAPEAAAPSQPASGD